jgi:hypothetical protein
MYRAAGTNATIGATKSPLTLMGGTAVVMCLKELKLYSEGVPGSDAMVVVHGRRFTAAGTGSAVTPGVNSPGMRPPAETTALSELSAEPTYTAGSIFTCSFNPRSPGAQWVAIDRDALICTPLTASNGVGLQCITVGGGTGVLRADTAFDE